jgi:tetratricopeptide (TPR) repeat protein
MDLVAGVLLVPFVGGGVYSLSRRFGHHEEWPMAVEAAILAAVTLFFAIEVALLRLALPQNPVFLMFSVLGLAAAGAALYGHVLISLASRLVVEAVSHGDERAADRPRFGPAESLEQQGAYQDALQEYLVLARIYPREAEVYARIAEIHLRLKNPDEAAVWWRRALKYASTAGEVLAFTNRLCETHERHLNDVQGAKAVLAAYLERYPDSPDAAVVRGRLERLMSPQEVAAMSEALVALDAAPMAEVLLEEAPQARIKMTLTALEDVELPSASPEAETAPEPAPEPGAKIGLSALEDDALEDEPEVPKAPKPRWPGLQALDDAPLDPDA